jgi:hypothetical protein
MPLNSMLNPSFLHPRAKTETNFRKNIHSYFFNCGFPLPLPPEKTGSSLLSASNL